MSKYWSVNFLKPFNPIVKLIFLFGFLLFFTHCGHDEGQGRPAPIISLECELANCPAGAMVKVYFVKESCALSIMSDEDYYFYGEGTIDAAECGVEKCIKKISTWTKKGGGKVEEFPEKTYAVCAFIDGDNNGVFEASAGDFSGTQTGVVLKKESQTLTVEVSTAL